MICSFFLLFLGAFADGHLWICFFFFSYIEEEDLLRFMIKEEVDLVFPLFDGAAETGRITRKAFTEWVVSLLRTLSSFYSLKINYGMKKNKNKIMV